MGVSSIMIVIGGTYYEYCQYPRRNRVMGSGLRAACALSQVSKDIKLFSSIDKASISDVEYTLSPFPIKPKWYTRNETVAFNYFTPISSPGIDGRLSESEDFEVNGDSAALVFGMIESSPLVKADKIIFDPQQPRDVIDLKLNRFSYSKLALLANVTETRNLGKDSNVRVAANNLLKKTGADVIVTKQGARGALVTTKKAQEEIGPHPTNRVMSIGSGDVFGAGFAWAWGELGYNPIDAAKVGSAAAAYYVSTETMPIPSSILHNKETMLEPALTPKDSKVYLAGPFFTLAECWLVDLLFPAIKSLGADVFSPLHHVGRGGTEVAEKDIKGLETCNSVLALLDHLDAGTIFEAGWASKQGIPVIGYSTNIDNEAYKMLSGCGAELHTDITTAVYRSIWRGLGALPLNV